MSRELYVPRHSAASHGNIAIVAALMGADGGASPRSAPLALEYFMGKFHGAARVPAKHIDETLN